jgi:hypothetical protein
MWRKGFCQVNYWKPIFDEILEKHSSEAHDNLWINHDVFIGFSILIKICRCDPPRDKLWIFSFWLRCSFHKEEILSHSSEDIIKDSTEVLLVRLELLREDRWIGEGLCAYWKPLSGPQWVELGRIHFLDRLWRKICYHPWQKIAGDSPRTVWFWYHATGLAQGELLSVTRPAAFQSFNYFSISRRWHQHRWSCLTSQTDHLYKCAGGLLEVDQWSQLH